MSSAEVARLVRAAQQLQIIADEIYAISDNLNTQSEAVAEVGGDCMVGAVKLALAAREVRDS